MKKRSLGIMSLSLLAAFSLYGQQIAKSVANPLLGTWLWVETRNANSKEFTNLRTKPEMCYVLITDTHTIYGAIDSKTMRFKSALFGGLYTKEGNMVTERHEFGYGSKEQQQCTFDWKVDGEKSLKSHKNGKGGVDIQVWERFKGTEKLTPCEEGNTMGQQLIDLKKAKDAGAITDAEYQAQKAKMLGGK